VRSSTIIKKGLVRKEVMQKRTGEEREVMFQFKPQE
jgi:hypothetical protein